MKFLFQLEDGTRVESVFMIEGKRRTVCLSTQVGCSLGCRFCATGKMGFQRNLSTAEIVDQLLIQREVQNRITHVVIMGMGEPLLNYDSVIKAAQLIHHQNGIAIGHRHITISTCGIVPKIIKYADDGIPFNLAISLNAPTDEQRSQIMPINKKYPLPDLMWAVRYYCNKLHRRVTFEYVLIAGVNDRAQDALNLRNLVKDIPARSILSPITLLTVATAVPRKRELTAS